MESGVEGPRFHRHNLQTAGVNAQAKRLAMVDTRYGSFWFSGQMAVKMLVRLRPACIRFAVVRLKL